MSAIAAGCDARERLVEASRVFGPKRSSQPAASASRVPSRSGALAGSGDAIGTSSLGRAERSSTSVTALIGRSYGRGATLKLD